MGLFQIASVATALAAGVAQAGKPYSMRNAYDLREVSPESDYALIRQGLDSAKASEVHVMDLSFSMENSWQDEDIFSGDYLGPDGSFNLTVHCNECYTHGDINADLSIEDWGPALEIDLNGVEAYFDLTVDATISEWITVNLFKSETPFGLSVPGLDVGIIFFVDLVFSLTQEVDFTGGFWIKLPDEAHIDLDLLGGDVLDSVLDGTLTRSLPVEVETATMTFKADLRLRLQAGVEATSEHDWYDIGAGAVVGVFANIVEFVTEIKETETCDLETDSWFDLNVAAYAKLSVQLGPTIIGPVPTISTTLLTGPTWTNCWMDGASTTPPAGTMTPTTAVGSHASTEYPTITPSAEAVKARDEDLVVSPHTATRCLVDAVNCPQDKAEEIVYMVTAAPTVAARGNANPFAKAQPTKLAHAGAAQELQVVPTAIINTLVL